MGQNNTESTEGTSNITVSGAEETPPTPSANPQHKAVHSMKKIATALLLMLMCFPVAGFFVALLTAGSAEARQYTILVPILLAIYNVPAVAISGLAYLAANHFIKTEDSRWATICFWITVLVSIVGVGFMVFSILGGVFAS